MSAAIHPIFPDGARVALVEKCGSNGQLFGVAMRGGRHVVPLPFGYDGLTSVRWINGFIFVAHPTMPPLMADTTTGKCTPVDPDVLERVKNDVRRELNLPRNTRIIH